LIRNPLEAPLGQSDYSSQPTTTPAPPGTRVPFWHAGNPNYAGGSFYNDFDYAATRVADGAGGSYLQFLGPESLNNSAGRSVYPLAAPRYRFGFIPTDVNNPLNLLGNPVEYDLATPIPNYIGTFAQAETSHAAFLYPGQAVDPRAGGGFTLNVDSLLADFTSGGPGPRQGADLLLQEVSQFDIEVWDAGFIEGDANGNGTIDIPGVDDLNGNGIRDQGAWVDLGHDESNSGTTMLSIGNFHINNRTNAAFGPRTPIENRVFDTWHPDIGVQPPFRPYLQSPPTTLPLTPAPPVRVDWSAGQAVNVGDYIFPDYVDSATLNDDNFAFVYRCVQGGVTSFKEPEWPRQHGAIVRENANTAQEVVWQC
ncbi:MAG: hypothetical protein KDA66_21015, partial [Planctomycetaceae bacterium]|nr:hypothetical protein [Planctomycetaceae bacterium]